MLFRLLSAGVVLGLAFAATGCSGLHHGRCCGTPTVSASVPVPPPPAPCNSCAPGVPGIPPPPAPVPGTAFSPPPNGGHFGR
jgi:hypothetical protein